MRKNAILALIIVAVLLIGYGLYSWRLTEPADELYLTAEDAEAALRGNPDDLMAHRRLGMQFYVKTDKQKAIHHLREAIRIAKRRDPNDAVAPYVLAQLLMEVGQRAEGIALLKSLAGLNNPVGRNARKTLEKYQQQRPTAAATATPQRSTKKL